jgi:hypothetical protein
LAFGSAPGPRDYSEGDSLACSVGTEETKTDLKVGLSPDPKARIPKPMNEI